MSSESVTSFTVGLEPVEDTFSTALGEIEAKLIDLPACYDAIYNAFRKMEQRRFNREGPGWVPLAPATVTQREYLGITGSHPILNRNGVTYEGEVGGSLRRSLTTKGAKYAFVEPFSEGIFIGTRHPVAIYHQMGTHGAGRDRNVSMPARPVVDVSEEDAEVFSSIISEYVYGFSANLDTSVFEPTAETDAVDVVGV